MEIEYSPAVEEKLWAKHAVEVSEVEEALRSQPRVRRAGGGVYHMLGRSEAGRYLFVVVRLLGAGRARLVTARDMTERERRQYRRW